MTDDIETMSISHFKATCLSVLENVRQTGQPVRVTRRGQPMAEIVPVASASNGATWLGSLRGSIRVHGDIVSPVSRADDWEALR
ncbi:MAG TPA: type II toxin-antitoxin system prevent-host-death family antitoxin [Gemmatimonadaceae bacterium]|jgi:prevent-host-death family protein|nr:type II toxin-antitoxin system prevent-host-death family antitoxin [Gemmatimonadaceae bacterium]